MREAFSAKLSILGSTTLEVIPSDAFVINSDGADEGWELLLRTAEADSKAHC